MSNGRYLYEKAVIAILQWLHLAEEDLVGHTIVTASGETGTCQALCLDDAHGLCFSFEKDGPGQRWMPVSTIKTHGPKNVADIFA